MLVFGVIGYLMKKLSLEAAPLVLAFVLGPMLETALRQSLIKSQGSFVVFLPAPFLQLSCSSPFSCYPLPFCLGFENEDLGPSWSRGDHLTPAGVTS